MDLRRRLRSTLAAKCVGSVQGPSAVVDLSSRGVETTVVCRPVAAQEALRRRAGRTLGDRLGVFEVLQALPLEERLPLDSLTSRERAILPAVPGWALRRSDRSILRLADIPVHVDVAAVWGEEPFEALDQACRLGPGAPRMAVCETPGDDFERAVLEADYHGIGLAVARGEEARVLVEPRVRASEAEAALRWRFAERVHRALDARKGLSPPLQPSTSAHPTG
ncbi:hypothetical protein [Nocardiopsis akebiae]|uniref:hypothetical protein n=1 Tax=Nocardiopsis akebiae TaxID=2831968 RepID=UPI0020169A78|nr:hypothetical protein [Nocardiopsis akebiae]